MSVFVSVSHTVCSNNVNVPKGKAEIVWIKKFSYQNLSKEIRSSTDHGEKEKSVKVTSTVKVNERKV